MDVGDLAEGSAHRAWISACRFLAEKRVASMANQNIELLKALFAIMD